jgi:hypothetical protein
MGEWEACYQLPISDFRLPNAGVERQIESAIGNWQSEMAFSALLIWTWREKLR